MTPLEHYFQIFLCEVRAERLLNLLSSWMSTNVTLLAQKRFHTFEQEIDGFRITPKNKNDERSVT